MQQCASPTSLELGYILLEDCRDVTLPEDTPRSEWLDVRVIEAERSQAPVEEACDCCSAAPIQKSALEELYMNYGEWMIIHGNARELVCQQCSMQRLDIEVVLGLLFANRAVVQVQSLRLSTNGCSTHFLLTLSFPPVLELRSLNSAATSTKHGPKKPLPTSLQTLLMIVESDWYRLQGRLVYLVNMDPCRTRKNPVSFFPKQLTIAELYQRLETTSEPPLITPGGEIRNSLLELPPEVWSRTLGTFLNANDVDNLRKSCKTLQHSLRDLIPGLRLQLYPHQIRSLVWMRQREQRVLSEHEILKESSNLHRSITGGVSVLLRSSDDSFCIRINTLTGEEYLFADDESSMGRNVARGGMLCDDPGLGKTITVLALILQTMFRNETDHNQISNELMNEKDHNRASDQLAKNGAANTNDDVEKADGDETQDDSIFYIYWSQEVTTEFRTEDYLKLVNGFLRRLSWIPFPVKQVRNAIANNAYGSDFRCFDAAVRSSIKAHAATYLVPVDQTIHAWHEMMTEFKNSQMRSVRRYFSSLASKPNSKVATLIDKERKEKLIQSLVPSTSTLLVVPAVLLDHWQSQMKQHVDWGYCTDRKAYHFVFTPQTSEKQLSNLILRTNNELEYDPILFLDRAGTVGLPNAKILAKFRLVITTTNRFKNEWKHGSFQREIQQQESNGVVQYHVMEAAQREGSTSCQLLRVNWKRMIVDEGHTMGNKASSTIQFASWIHASRRWVMTGTPTKHGGAELTQLSGLLKFLGHEFFTARSNGDGHWKRQIAKEWQEGNFASFFRLSSLMGCLMKLHTKLDFDVLAPPEYDTTKVPMSSTEVATYNTLVSGVQSNILLTSMDSKTSGLQDSLLSRNQAKNARQALSNIRRVCTGCTRVVPVLSDASYRETLIMAERLGLSPDELVNVKKYIHCVESEGQPECGVCAFRVPTQVLMSCCGGTECMSHTTATCFLCEKKFDPDELQQFQPGFEMNWKLNLDSKLKGEREAAPATVSDTMPTDSNPSLDHEGVIIRPIGERRRTRKPRDGHTCQYDKYRIDGICSLCLEAHDSCDFMNEHSRCQVCHRAAEPCPEEESKSSYLVEKLLRLYRKHPRRTGENAITEHQYMVTDYSRPLKVIVFSQFRQTLNSVGDRLLRRFGAGCVGEYFGKHRSQELHKFTFDRSCFCLLLTKDGAEGLDLSFVTNIIFLDEIYDQSLRDQAVARAWRMGAKGSVKVETLVAKNSVEETLGEMESNRTKDSANGATKERIKTLLLSLRLITDYHYFVRSSGSTETQTVSSPENKRKRTVSSHPEALTEPVNREKRVRFVLDQ